MDLYEISRFDLQGRRVFRPVVAPGHGSGGGFEDVGVRFGTFLLG